MELTKQEQQGIEQGLIKFDDKKSILPIFIKISGETMQVQRKKYKPTTF